MSTTRGLYFAGDSRRGDLQAGGYRLDPSRVGGNANYALMDRGGYPDLTLAPALSGPKQNSSVEESADSL